MTFAAPARAVALALAASLALAGCARDIRADATTASAVGATIRTESGVVEAARFVTVEEADRLRENSTGGLIGGATGGIVGSTIGGGFGQAVAIAAGALIGFTAGALIEQETSRQAGIEYVVRLETGELFTIVQGPEDPIEVGTEVFVQFQRGESRARIVRA